MFTLQVVEARTLVLVQDAAYSISLSASEWSGSHPTDRHTRAAAGTDQGPSPEAVILRSAWHLLIVTSDACHDRGPFFLPFLIVTHADSAPLCAPVLLDFP